MKQILTTQQISELIEKVVGDIDFWGESNHDADALESVRAFGELTVDLVLRLLNQYSLSLGRIEASICSLNETYGEWLDAISELIEQYKEIKEETK